MRPRVCLKEDRSYINGFLREFGLSVQMRLYTMHKREFVMVFIVFFAALGLALFIGLAGPPITVTAEQQATQLMTPLNHSQLTSGPFIMKTPALSTYAQQLWVIAKVLIKVQKNQSFRKEFQLNVMIEGLTRTQESQPLLSLHQPHNRSRTLECDHSECHELSVTHLSFLRYTHYIITVKFYDLAELQKWYQVTDVVFYFKTYNPTFTKLEIWIRFIFLLLTFIIDCWLAHSLRKYAMYDWSIEQKWLSVLLPLLLLYNDPVFPFSFLTESWIPGLVDTVFQATFLAALLFFWLALYHALRQNERPFTSFYLPKLIVVGMLWLCLVVAAWMQRTRELHDPLYSASLDTAHFQNFKIFFFVLGTVYALYLVYLIITAYSELRSMPYFDLRLRFATSLLVVVLVAGTIITAIGFPPSAALQDLSAGQLGRHYQSSAPFMALYSLFNLYLFTMAYVYSPSERALMETHIIKDNPALSMMNDSDEDVIYGSDDETRRPLNRGSNDNDESD